MFLKLSRHFWDQLLQCLTKCFKNICFTSQKPQHWEHFMEPCTGYKESPQNHLKMHQKHTTNCSLSLISVMFSGRHFYVSISHGVVTAYGWLKGYSLYLRGNKTRKFVSCKMIWENRNILSHSEVTLNFSCLQDVDPNSPWRRLTSELQGLNFCTGWQEMQILLTQYFPGCLSFRSIKNMYVTDKSLYISRSHWPEMLH